MNATNALIAATLSIGLVCQNVNAANRLFMAKAGEHDLVAASGPTTVYMYENDSVTIEVWLESDGSEDLAGYAFEVPWSATPTTGIGTVQYVDNRGTGFWGDSVFIDVDAPAFPFPEGFSFGPAYNESDGTDFAAYGYGVVVPCQPHVGGGIIYWGEFQIRSTEQSIGDYTLGFSDPDGNTSAAIGDCSGLFPMDEYQSLTIVVVESAACSNGSHCCPEGNCESCSAYYCDYPPGEAPCTGQPNCACAVEPRIFGDAGGNGGACEVNASVNVHDANHVWNAFQGINACDQEDGNPENADVGGNGGMCAKSGSVNMHDANHVWGVFQNINPCSAMCSSGPSPISHEWQPPGYTDSADVTLAADSRKASPGDVISVDVLIDQPLADLQGFQLEALATGGTRGHLELIDIAIESRRDHVFARTGIDQSAANLNRGVIGAILPSAGLEGVATRADGYLATFTYQVSPDALGTFVIDLNNWHDRGQFAQETFLTSSYFGMVEISSTTPAVVVIANDRAESINSALRR